PMAARGIHATIVHGPSPIESPGRGSSGGRTGVPRNGILLQGPQATGQAPTDRLKTEDRRPPRQDPVVTRSPSPPHAEPLVDPAAALTRPIASHPARPASAFVCARVPLPPAA